MKLTLRRWLAVGLLVVAAMAVAVTVIANVDGVGGFAWRCDGGGQLCFSPKRGGHIYLRPLAHPLLGIALAAGLVAAAAQLAVRHRVLRVASQAVVAVVAVAALLLGLLESLGPRVGASRDAVVATSPNFRLVSYRSPGFFSSGSVLLRLQSREGIASREGSESLACFIEASSGAGPEWLFGRASFVDNDEVALSAKDGTTWRVRFDTKTLSSVNRVDRCTDAPDPAAD
ncbi:hypothetical protein Q2K19_08825 [Micromonospora soli]|uniref:hypothetical protein n=1 Tax=Micromonospora sp. NBRC 110009 TaxID=3061627 RepID=UPI002672849B|nr:hypothetical protein [Micromonospora sp. NBRC 110009]WKU00567.1 hypothetical protein Q2K19_08825 [Micromonospora sp. NBRC 110009]